MERVIKKLIKVIKNLEELIIALISLFGWLAILIIAIKGLF